MRIQYRLFSAFMLSLVTVPLIALAEPKEVNVAYLRAAITTLSDRESVLVVATFLPDPGLVEPQRRWGRQGGVAQFSIRDIKTGAVFTSMYCMQNSSAFKDLIAIAKPTAFRFRGYKGDGERNEAAIYVTSVESYTEAAISESSKAGVVPSDARYRVTIIDNATSNRTVLADVAIGRSYNAGGVTLRVEPERNEEIGVIGPETEIERGVLRKGANAGGY